MCPEQVFFLRNEQKYLENHVIEIKQADSEFECGIHCVPDKLCASVNYKTSGIGKGRCELNNKTLQETSDEETYNPEFTHVVVIKQVSEIISAIFSHLAFFYSFSLFAMLNLGYLIHCRMPNTSYIYYFNVCYYVCVNMIEYCKY